jgi:hypothetical protein
LLFCLFIGHVMSDDAAAERADDSVAGIVAGDAADDSAFQAALSLGWSGRHTRRQYHSESGGDCVFHDASRLL